MCGILFINSKNKNLDKNKCLKAFKTLKTRGPDKLLHEFINKKNFLGNSILSITGEVKKGFKLYNFKKIKLSFNGEIYNYKELQKNYNLINDTIKSDTDVLIKLNLKLGVKKTPGLLNGMFAYCVFNKKKKNCIFCY